MDIWDKRMYDAMWSGCVGRSGVQTNDVSDKIFAVFHREFHSTIDFRREFHSTIDYPERGWTRCNAADSLRTIYLHDSG